MRGENLMAKPVDVDDSSFSVEVLEAEEPVIVDFWSPTCPHCLRLNPDFEAAAEQAEGKYKFCKVSAQAARPLFSQHGIRAVPTLILFNGGKEVVRREGAQKPEAILLWLEENV
jgi:thioredoxin 2